MTATARPVGRPRSAACDQAILDATLKLFTELGFDGLSVEGVAAQAGVGKATIYRRYASKVDLVMAAARRISDERPYEPDTGTVEGDLRSVGRRLVGVLARTPAGPALRQLIAELPRNADLLRAHREFIDSRRAPAIAAIRRGVERGELRADTDADVMADGMSGPIFYRYLVGRTRLNGAYVDCLVDALMRAYRT